MFSNGGMIMTEVNKKTNKTKKTKKNSKLRFALKISILVVLLLMLFATLFLYVKYGDDISEVKMSAEQLVSNSSLDTFRSAETSIVYGADGKQISVLKGEKDMYYIELDDIPQEAIDAMVVTEDKKFYKHKGIDLKAIVAAGVSLVKNNGEMKRGGSTITQQLARNIFLSNEKTFSRKIKEIFISLNLEKKYNKKQIMEFYLNNIYFANGYYGIEAASKGYFGKSCKELSLAQITFICSIPNSPTRYDPCVNFDNTIERKNRILDQMLADEKITDTEYNEAYNEEIKLKTSKTKKRNFVETYVTYCAVRALMKVQGFEFTDAITAANSSVYDEQYSDMYSQCQQMLYRSGYRIYTSIDIKKQKQLQTAINDALEADKEKGEDGIYKFQGAGVCIDNDTGKVVAAVGGRGQSVTGYTFNRAYQSYRQPGSSIKPVLVYTPAFERVYNPGTVMKDEPIEDGPKNSNGKYSGNITLRKAVEQSTNTIAWRLFDELNPEVCLRYLLKMNFARIQREDYTLAASLGGFTKGVSPVEMAAAYATLENEGIYREPTCIITITDAEGNPVVSDVVFEEEHIYDREATLAMTDVLQGVFKNGTARGFALDNMACAGKTGTTNDKKDGWFIGYTPYYTTSVWVGCDIPESRSDLLGNTYPARIWKTYMSEIHTDLPNVAFTKYEGEGSEVKKTPKPTKDPEEELEDNEPDDFEEDQFVPDDGMPDNSIDFDEPITNDQITTIATDVPPTQAPATQPPVAAQTPVPEPTQAPAAPTTDPDMPNNTIEEESF